MAHPSDREVERFVRDELQPAERRRVVRHLLAGCPACRKRLAPWAEVLFHAEELKEAAVRTLEDPYRAALDRALAQARRYESRFRKERARMEEALEAARAAPPEEIACDEVTDLYGWCRVEALLRLSFEERYRDPQKMVMLAFIAKVLAERLDAKEHGAALIADLQARAWTELGNAYRVNERLEDADEALDQALGRVQDGTGDPLLLARVADVRASLRSDQRRLGEALDLLETVHGLYLGTGDLHLAGRALISRGISTHYDGNPREAVRLLREGLDLIEADRDPQMVAIGLQSLIHALTDCGEHREAARLLLGSDLQRTFEADPLNLLKLRGVEGKVLAGLGKLPRAERIFEEVHEGFLERGRGYDAALVGLELAAVWLRQGRMANVREIVEETLETLQELGVQTEAVKAVVFLRVACRRQEASAGLVYRVRDFLARLQWQPQLRFSPLG